MNSLYSPSPFTSPLPLLLSHRVSLLAFPHPHSNTTLGRNVGMARAIKGIHSRVYVPGITPPVTRAAEEERFLYAFSCEKKTTLNLRMVTVRLGTELRLHLQPLESSLLLPGSWTGQDRLPERRLYPSTTPTRRSALRLPRHLPSTGLLSLRSLSRRV